MTTTDHDLARAARILRGADHAIAFTGAGVSVESGIPSFRGEGGLWHRYDPRTLEIGFFLARPGESWPVIREIFYEHWGVAEPNPGHRALARLETDGPLREVVTQNIDGLHQAAGSRRVWEFHGASQELLCLGCGVRRVAAPELLEVLPATCPDCGGLLKPDFVFFGEGIPPAAAMGAQAAAEAADAVLVVGSTGEVYPAASVPEIAARRGAGIIEVNVEPTRYTSVITTCFLKGKAGEILPRLAGLVLDS